MPPPRRDFEKTRLVLEQSGYRERKNRDEQEQGWPAFLDQLAKALRV